MDTFPRAELNRLTDRTGYPGINQEEWRSLREYIRRHGTEYDELRFNVRIGIGITLQGDYTEKFVKDWEERTKMRPDCIGFVYPNVATIIEAKVQWTNHAVWQVSDYRDRYQHDHPGDVVHVIGVAEAYTENARQLSSDKGIKLFIYAFPPEDPLAGGTEDARS